MSGKIDFKTKNDSGSGTGMQKKKPNIGNAVKIATKGVNAVSKAGSSIQSGNKQNTEAVGTVNSMTEEAQDAASEFSDSKKYYEKMYQKEKTQFKKAESRVYNIAKKKVSKKIRDKITQKAENHKSKKEIEVNKNSVPKNPDVSVKGQNRTNFDVKSGINQPINNVPAKGTGIVKAPGTSASSAASASTGVSTATASSTGVATTATGTTATAASTGTATGAVTGTAAGTTTATATGTTAATTAGTTAATVATGTAATTTVGAVGTTTTVATTTTVSAGSALGPIGIILIVAIIFLMITSVVQMIVTTLTSFVGFTPGTASEDADYIWATPDDIIEAYDSAFWDRLEWQIAAAEENKVSIKYNTGSWNHIIAHYNCARYYGVDLKTFLISIGWDGIYEETSDGVKIERVIQEDLLDVINSLVDEEITPKHIQESYKTQMDYFVLFADDLDIWVKNEIPEEDAGDIPAETIQSFSSVITPRLYEIVYDAYHSGPAPDEVVIDIDYSLPAYISMLKGENIESVLEKMLYIYKDENRTLHVELIPDWNTIYELTDNEYNSYQFVKSNYDLPSMEVGTKLEDFVDIDNLAPPAPPPEAPTGNPELPAPGGDITAPPTGTVTDYNLNDTPTEAAEH